MNRYRGAAFGAWCACVVCVLAVAGAPLAADQLPEKLADGEFWSLVLDLSEPAGNFRSDNLLSNESRLQHVIPGLTRVVRPGGVYMGVGPEQNFTYISALKPSMAFIVDVRRGNLHLHLMYKSLFELSADRPEFVSRLFSRPRPEEIGPHLTADAIFTAYENVEKSEELFARNLADIKNHLVQRHKFPLSVDDLAGIEYVYHAFYEHGPGLRYSSTAGAAGRLQPSYSDLMKATDGRGRPYGFLANDTAFGVLKDLQTRNMLVPVVGNFGGPKAIKAVGEYVRARESTVSTFYLSNVEPYLWEGRLWDAFCDNIETLPIDETSTFIRAIWNRTRSGFGTQLGVMLNEVASCR